jgi:tetratricopeptide (TPR) repeat protein
MSDPAIIAEARELITRGECGLAVQRLMAAVPRLSAEFRRKAYSYAGLACYFDERFADAVGMFQAAARESDVPEDWLNMAMAQAKVGDLPGARASWQQAFDLSYAHQDAPESSSFFEKKLMFARELLLAGGADELGLDLLERQLMGFFTSNRITDTQFWASRGVPAFEEVLALTREYYRALGRSAAEWAASCDRVAAAVDESGRDYCARLREDY